MLVLTVQIEHYPVWIVFEYKLIVTRVQNNFSFDEKTLNRTIDSSFSIHVFIINLSTYIKFYIRASIRLPFHDITYS